MNIKRFEEKFSVKFQNKKLLQQAFTHSSYANEHRNRRFADNERLEFLGDAVLEIVVSDYLFQRHKRMSEGELSKLRAAIVCEESLYYFSDLLSFNEYILLGKGEENSGGRERPALLADVFEAFLGALYLDQGLKVCYSFMEKHIFPNLTRDVFSHMMDYKTKLQELIQQKKGTSLKYVVVGEKGPSHNKKFIVEVTVNDTDVERGSGRSKKEAEQEAAKKMLQRLT